MPTCNICLESAQRSYDPPNRHHSCTCVYTVHEACYNTWLSRSNMAYNCIICHKTVRNARPEPRPVQEPEVGQEPGLGPAAIAWFPYLSWLKWWGYFLLAAFLIRYIKEILVIGFIALYTYVSISQQRRGRNMFYYYAMNFLFDNPIPEYHYPHVYLVRRLIRFWQ